MRMDIIRLTKTFPLLLIVSLAAFAETIFVTAPSYGQPTPGPGPAFHQAAPFTLQAAPVTKVGSVEEQRRRGEALITAEGTAKNPAEGVKLLEGAIAAGDIRAMAVLGKFYADGYYLPRDAKKGMALLQSAAAAADPDALLALGQAYLWGSGVRANASKALDFLQRGATAGSVEAQGILGEQLITGWVLAKNRAEGLKLLEAAIATGDVRAKAILGRLYIEGSYLPRDAKKGMALLESAAAAKNHDALTALGLAYLSGRGVSANPAKALDYLQRAVKGGNKEARRRLGEALITGSGVVRNRSEGVQLLEAAGKNGDAKSLVILGQLLLEGRLVKINPEGGRALLEKAAKLGEVAGVEQLGGTLMWSARSATDRKLAENYLTMAGKAGKGSAWTTLAQGAMYGKLSKASNGKYKMFVENARALGDAQIEIVEADRWMWGAGGARANPTKAISTLEAAAAAGNQDAIEYLIRLQRDGNGWNIKKSSKRADAYFAKYGGKLTKQRKYRQRILLQAAKSKSLNDFGQLSGEIGGHPELASHDFHKQVFRANPNFSIFLLQEKLRDRKVYEGPINGLATARTLASIRLACDALRSRSKCTGPILSDGVIAQVIMN